MKPYQLAVALPFMLAFGVAGHAVLARGVKTVLWAWSPLASGEPEAASYERRVYHTADAPMMQIVAAAAAVGLVLWLGLVTGSKWFWLAGVGALAGVVVLDVLRWERVAISSHNLWFQRGFTKSVHQVALENIRDVSVDETAARGFTLRHGTHNRLVRLHVRMNDKRVVALPKTDADSGLDAVEAVANHLRMRLQQIQDRNRPRRPRPEDLPPPGSLTDAVATQDEDLRRALARLRHHAAKSQEKSRSSH